MAATTRSPFGMARVAATWDGGVDVRTNAASAGLQSIRIAAAAARLRAGDALNDRDRSTLATVSAGLRHEARILRHEVPPSMLDETAYAFAGVALSALSTSPDPARTEDGAAKELDALANTLDRMQSDQSGVDAGDLETIERIFFRASELVRASLSRTGELIDGDRETSATYVVA